MRRNLAFILAAGVVAGIAVTAAFALRPSPSAQCGTTALAGGAIGGPFTLVSETGQTVSEQDVITQPSLIYFGYTFCPDVCPLDAARNALAADLLAERGIPVTPVFITIDPARDTVDVVRDYTENFHPDMIGLTGTDEQIRTAANAYRVVYSKQDDDPEFYLMSHSVFTYFVTPEDGFVDVFRREASAEEIAQTVSCHLQDG